MENIKVFTKRNGMLVFEFWSLGFGVLIQMKHYNYFIIYKKISDSNIRT